MGGSSSTLHVPPVYIKFYDEHVNPARFATIKYRDASELEVVDVYNNTLRIIKHRKVGKITKIVISHETHLVPNPAAIESMKRLWSNQIDMISHLPKADIDKLVLDFHFPYGHDWKEYKDQFTRSIKQLATALNIRISVVKAEWHYGGDVDSDMEVYARELQDELNK
jgi:hypothetical protein